MLVLSIMAALFVIACGLFNFRVSWAKVHSRRYHDRRLAYFVTAELATIVAGVTAWRTSDIWLTKTAMACDAAGDNGGLAYFLLLAMGTIMVLVVGASVYCCGTEGESFWAKKAIARQRKETVSKGVQRTRDAEATDF